MSIADLAHDEVSLLRVQVDHLRVENKQLRAEIEVWRAKLATQCGHTLAMQALLNRELESNSRRDCPEPC